ncbi:hypothetical protein BDE36_1725 [Arcticibacter tournemirensis]|uniref:Uncharacterized protein n=1 Tax=Arcticibacter tournemirensis TaxID=699437 RepID=A0A5M9HA40_9SPHI|nr:hypothetical protein [Arcticibacter tournemirensis]KAA8483803.1 hypothetical protein F1649_07920 [Arcticibacter tournemirensis]TQM49991.1 hypothetical protein BDE36_1725 [Arcticibacter tournemirensis]
MAIDNTRLFSVQHKVLEIYENSTLDYYLLEGDVPVISQSSLLDFLGIQADDVGNVFFPEQKDIVLFTTSENVRETGIPVELIPLLCAGFAEHGINDPLYKQNSYNALRLMIGLSLLGLDRLIDETPSAK